MLLLLLLLLLLPRCLLDDSHAPPHAQAAGSLDGGSAAWCWLDTYSVHGFAVIHRWLLINLL